MNIEQFNQISEQQAHQLLMECCYCEAWASRVVTQRPFSNLSTLKTTCINEWELVEEAELLEAFDHHPKIGDKQALKDKFSKATKEQGQILAASDDVIEALYKGNEAYEQKNGFIFIVCASGKPAEEMLTILQKRLPNDREHELANAANEQAKIMLLRLETKIEEE